MRPPTFQQQVAKMLIIDKLPEQAVIEKLEAEGIAPGQARDAVRRVKYAQKRKEREKILGTPKVRYQTEDEEEGWGSFRMIIGVLIGLFVLGRGLYWVFESKGDFIPIFSILFGILIIIVRLGSSNWD